MSEPTVTEPPAPHTDMENLYEKVISNLANSDGSYTVQLGHVKLSKCDDRGMTQTDRSLQKLRDDLIR